MDQRASGMGESEAEGVRREVCDDFVNVFALRYCWSSAEL